MREQELLSERGALIEVIAELAWENFFLRGIFDETYRDRAGLKRREQRRFEQGAA